MLLVHPFQISLGEPLAIPTHGKQPKPVQSPIKQILTLAQIAPGSLLLVEGVFQAWFPNYVIVAVWTISFQMFSPKVDSMLELRHHLTWWLSSHGLPLMWLLTLVPEHPFRPEET